MIFHTKFLQHSGGLRNIKEFGFSILGLSSEVSLISNGNYSLSLVTIVRKVIHSRIGCFDGFLSLRLGQLDDAGVLTICHEVARHAARGRHSWHRLRWLVRPSMLVARPGVHPRRNKVFLLELRCMAGQTHALNDSCVLRTPGLEMPNRPKLPMIHHVLVLR